MVVIVGFIVVIASVLGGFTMAGGNVQSLIHPSEIVTIGGAALGALIVMSPKKVLIDLVKGMLQSLKGAPFRKKAYEELFKAMRADDGGATRGLRWKSPATRTGSIFQIPHDRQNPPTQFICSSLSMLVDRAVTPNSCRS
jgi:flagellar motor component MotA